MTVTTETNTVVYSGDDATLVFPYPFRILDALHLGVFISLIPIAPDDVTFPYTISGVDDPDGGVVTFTLNPPPTGVANLTLSRNVPATQEIDYTPYDDFPADTHERGLDKLTMLVQQAISLAGEGTIHIPANEIPLGLNLEVPPIAFRKEQVLAFDVFGNVTVVAGPGGVSGTVVDVQPGVNGFLDARELLLVDNATFGARLPLIGIPGINAPGRLMQLNPAGVVSPEFPGGIPLSILENTPALLFAVLSDDGTFGLPYDPDYITDDLIKFTRQAGVDVPFAEVMQVQNINGIKRLVATDANGQIPAELLSFQGLRNLGSWRGDNLCPKFFDGLDPGGDPCAPPDYRNPSDVLPGTVFETGDFFAVTITSGEELSDNRISLYSETAPGVITLSDVAVSSNDGIQYIDVIATIPTIPVGWYHMPDRFDMSTAVLTSLDEGPLDYIGEAPLPPLAASNLQAAWEWLNNYLKDFSAAFVSFPVSAYNYIGPATDNVEDAITDLDTAVKTAMDAMMGNIFPVGSYRIGPNPNSSLPGTWEQVPEGTFLMSTISGAEPSGGSNAVTISEAQLPSHTHTMDHGHPSTDSGLQSANHVHDGSALNFDGNDLPAHDHDAVVLPWIASGILSTGGTHALSGNNASTPITMPKTSLVSAGAPSGDITGNTGVGSADHTHAISVGSFAVVTAAKGDGNSIENRPTFVGVEIWTRTV